MDPPEISAVLYLEEHEKQLYVPDDTLKLYKELNWHQDNIYELRH